MEEGGGACGLGGEEPVGRGEEPVDQEGRSLWTRWEEPVDQERMCW